MKLNNTEFMKNISATDKLRQSILLLEVKQAEELMVLKEQIYIAYESIKPVNIFKDAFHEVVSSPEIKTDIISQAIGLATGYLSKKVMVGASHNPIKKLLGNILQVAIARVVSKNSETIKSTGEII